MQIISKDLQLLNNWIFGYQISQAIFVAAKLNLADLLEEKPLTCEELSKLTNCHSEALYRLLRTLCSLDIFEEISEATFGHTSLSRMLISSHQYSVHAAAMMYGDEQYRAWGGLMESVKTGEDSFSKMYGSGFFSYLDLHPESFNTFNRFINNHAKKRIEVILDAYDFSFGKKIIDLGGGDGQLLMRLLHKYPNLEGVVFDTKEVIALARETSEIDLNNRIQFIAGDFFQGVPSGGDVFLLSHIIHNWRDEKAILILKNCRQKICKKGKLILFEHIISTAKGRDPVKWMDLNMLVILNGKERTEREYRRLLEVSGFKLNKIIQTPIRINIIEAIPV